MPKPLSLLIVLVVAALFTQCNSANADAQDGSAATGADAYQCLPCGRECDKKTLDAPGKCSGCGMELIKKTTVRFRSIEPAAVCRYIKDHPETILLDVRTKDEFEGKADPDFGALKGAINIPVQQLQARLGELDRYKSKEIIVYCSHSHRSPQASYLLTQNGFTNVVNMAGGMSVLKDKDCLQ